MKNLRKQMHEWFVHLFETRAQGRGFVNCFECNKKLDEKYYKENTCCYSHVLGKKKYPELAGNPKNVVIVCPDCHNLYELKQQEAVNQYGRKQELINTYNL